MTWRRFWRFSRKFKEGKRILYQTKPRSRRDIRQSAAKIRLAMGLSPGQAFPVVECMEREMTKFIPDFNPIIEPANEMPSNTYAYYDPIRHELHVEESVYERACVGVPRDRFTIAHELAHAFLLYNVAIYVARQDGRPSYYSDPEWQANEFAAELLAPCHEIRGMPISNITARYGVSKAMAKVQLNKK